MDCPCCGCPRKKNRVGQTEIGEGRRQGSRTVPKRGKGPPLTTFFQASPISLYAAEARRSQFRMDISADAPRTAIEILCSQYCLKDGAAQVV